MDLLELLVLAADGAPVERFAASVRAAEDEAYVLNELRLACAVPKERRTWMVELFPAIIGNAVAYAGEANRLKDHGEARDLLKRMRQYMLDYPYNHTAMRRAAEPNK